MKRLLLFLFFAAGLIKSNAQPFGNEWIDVRFAHYKIEVTADGIYRIPYAVCSTAINNFSSLNPQTLVMYHNGEAVPIYVSTNTTFGTNDYIEFYGKMNRGEMDSLLYRAESDQINPLHSLFTNTSVYYLTTNNLTNNPRLTFTPNVLAGLPPKEEYHMYTLFSEYAPNLTYYAGKPYRVSNVTETYKPLYDVGEGYAYPSFGNNGSQDFQAITPSVYYQGPDAIFRARYANVSNESHVVTIKLNSASTLYTQQRTDFQLNNVQVNVPIAQLNNGMNLINFNDAGNGISSDKNKVGLVSIEYPRDFNFSAYDRFYFEVDASAASKYLEINFNDQNTQPLLYDLTNGLIYRSTQLPGSSLHKFKLNPSGVKRQMYIRVDNSATYTQVTQLRPVNFVDYKALVNQGEYFIVSNSTLFDDGTGTNWVEEYRKYRDNQENPVSGKFNQARIANIDLIYDQFGYGIRKSPLGLRNFINYLSQSSDVQLKTQYVFLIGKGREAPTFRSGSGAAFNQCLVPTFGYPGSDNLLAASRTSNVASVAIGRLAAENGTQVKDYLTKMRSYEEAQTLAGCGPPEWQKEVLHFSGGTTGNEQRQFKGFVNAYQTIVEDSLWGAHVTSFSKTTNDPISVTQSEAIKAKINEGVSWITFFGHSATGAFDFSIDEPENYTNENKYPIILSNGCFSGFIHDAAVGYSERFVFPSNKGAIAFMATSSLSTPRGLNDFTARMYQNLSVNKYNQPLGKIFQKTLSDLFNTANLADFTDQVAQEMTLHGDPALKPNQYPKPDYALQALYTTPNTITPGTNNFEVNVIVKNLGKVSVDDTIGGFKVDSKLSIKLTRTYYDASNNPVTNTFTKQVDAPYFKDTFSFTLPVGVSTLGYGQNQFDVEINSDNAIEELATACNNNKLSVSAYIQNDDIIPIYPYEFAIVPDKGVTLKASTVNPFAPLRNYRFQIDTTELFNSDSLREGVVSQVGGVVRWPTNVNMYRDSTVYYWRVKKDSVGAQWHYSSFIYLNGEYPGWNQSHYYQYKKDDSLNLILDNDRAFKFPPSTNQIHVRTGKASVSGGNVDFETLGWDYNNYNSYRYRMGGCGYNSGLTFAVIDPVSGLPWVSHNYVRDNYGDLFANVHCADKGDQNGFDFTTGNSAVETQRIKDFIDAIPTGFYVLMYSVNNPNFGSWSPGLVTALSQIGFVAQPYVDNNFNGSVVYFNQKGNPNYSPFQADSAGSLAVVDTSFNFTGAWYQGSFTSTKIGPAVEWKSVHWQRSSLDSILTNDRDSLDVIGIRADGFEKVLLTTSVANNILDQQVFDATTYPYLKLRLRTFDIVTRTPTQLYYWRVLYKKPPEGAINPAAVQVLNMTNSVTQGGNFHLEIPFESVTDVRMDSLLTKFVIRDANLANVNFTTRFDTLGAFDTIMLVVDYPITSNNYLGVNRIIIEANPDDDQIEQYHFNNIAELSFSASGDKINPLLDVTFDNQHILDGDIVSAKPNILMTLKDENKFLALNDQSLVDVYVLYPGAAQPTKITYDNAILKFYPADSTNLTKGNRAQVEFKPEFVLDGKYELLVKTRDRSGNNSATNDATYQGIPATFFDYKISFEVITKAMITNVLNYPNPFTTATHFVFTVTGSEVPDDMKIQIVTIKGTVVKEIFKDELGPLHVGRNITEYAWDGRDQYGDLLANGIYFYHVISRLDDKRMDQMSMSYDKYFKKGFGKMALVR